MDAGSDAGAGAGAGAKAAAGADTHPLQNTWVLWELRERQNSEPYMSRHYPLFEFSSVEEFWSNWVHIPKPSDVFCEMNSDDRVSIKRTDPKTKEERVSYVEAYVLFKKGMEPETEFTKPDGTFATMFELRWRANRRGRFAEFDKAWEVTVLGIIGQCFGSQDTINGARFVDKCARGNPVSRLEVWMSSEEHAEVVQDRIKQAIEFETRGNGRGHMVSPAWTRKRHNGSMSARRF